MNRIRPLILPLCVAALLAAALLATVFTGGVSKSHVVPTCPHGTSTMGCAAAHHISKNFTLVTPPRGPKFPDVSSWQGHPNWDAAKGHITMASVKAGEYVEDPDFAWNVAQLKRLRIPWAPYWFVRNTGCAHEGAEIVSVIKSVGGLTSLPVVLDMEVPEARGYAPCLDAAVYGAFHRHALIYTAPGTWPGGPSNNLQLWIADYGSGFPCMWTCHPIGWQYTDGAVNAPTFIPGIGLGDVSVDYGFSKLLPSKPVVWSYHQAYVLGFQRGFTVAWLERRHKVAPSFLLHVPKYWASVFNVGFQAGFAAGWK